MAYLDVLKSTVQAGMWQNTAYEQFTTITGCSL